MTNKSNKAITINTEDAYVNGKATYSSCYLKFTPEKTIIGDIEFDNDSIIYLKYFKNIRGYLNIFDSNTYDTLSNTFFESK